MNQRLNRIPYYGFWALLIYMPFHIFLSQSLSELTGGLEVWKIGKDVVLALLTLFTICLVWRRGSGTKAFWWLIAGAAAYAALHAILWASHPAIYERSAELGFIYNTRVPAFAILGFGAYLLQPHKFVFSSVIKMVAILGSIVAFLGLLQWVLPKDVLTHFGYSLARGARPAFFIDDNQNFPRIMSTLREPNALGAYLLVPVAASIAWWSQVRHIRHRAMVGALLCIQVLALFLTQSRSAWLALVVVVLLSVYWQYRAALWRAARRWWPALVTIVLVVGAAGWMQRHTPFVQQYVVHSNPAETTEDLDSNDLHKQLVERGLHTAAEQPLGHGPGTAGLASIQNPAGGQLTENYYIQLAIEVGWIGVALFIALQAWLYIRLWRRHDSLGYVLCATFWGYVLTNMLLHTWSNEAVAAQWWLLAGVGAASLVPTPTGKKRAKLSDDR